MPKPATRDSWELSPLPSQREKFELPVLFSDAEGELLRLGHVPKEMEDKWFVLFEEGWLYFHRSWTGFCIFALRLEASPNGICVAEGWVNRDKAQYTSADIESDKRDVQDLIKSRLLEKHSSGWASE